MKYEETLIYKLRNEIELTDEQKESFYNLVSKGCRQDTKSRLWNIINYNYIYNRYGIYERVYFDGNVCRYCAGQSYTDEIRALRDCLLGR